MDFLFDRLSRGGRLKTLNIADGYSGELIGQLTRSPIAGARMARFLDRINRTRGLPDAVICGKFGGSCLALNLFDG